VDTNTVLVVAIFALIIVAVVLVFRQRISFTFKNWFRVDADNRREKRSVSIKRAKAGRDLFGGRGNVDLDEVELVDVESERDVFGLDYSDPKDSPPQ
jgi:hypothetical protein